jgi:transcriptional regulator with XRE-family HTH domain
LSRDELGKTVGTSGAVIGRYERDEITPSVENTKKIADVFGVTVDYLLGEGEYSSYDQDTIDRIKNIQKNGYWY